MHLHEYWHHFDSCPSFSQAFLHQAYFQACLVQLQAEKRPSKGSFDAWLLG